MRIHVGIASALMAAACGGSSSPTSYGGANPPPPPPPPPGATVETVSMTDYAFTPGTPTIKAGTVVKWVNNGSSSHTATSDGGTFDSGALAAPGSTTDPYGGTMTTPGGSFSVTFSAPGTYTYHCTFHGALNNMKGTITVTQ